MDRRNVTAILEVDVDVSAKISGHRGACLSNDGNSLPSIGSEEEPGLEDHVVPRSSAFLPFERIVRREEEDPTRTDTSCFLDLLVDRWACREVHRVILNPQTEFALHEQCELGGRRSCLAAISEEYVGAGADLIGPRVELVSKPCFAGPQGTEPFWPEDHRSLRQQRDPSRPHQFVGDNKPRKAPCERECALEAAVLRREVDTLRCFLLPRRSG